MLILEFQGHRVNEEGRETFDSYEWWKELVSRAAQGADRFELRCWEDEREGIAFGQKYGEQQESSTQELVYTGALSPEALGALIDGCVAADGALSYFTLNLYSGEKMLFSSSHRGGGAKAFRFCSPSPFRKGYLETGLKTPQPSISRGMMFERV